MDVTNKMLFLSLTLMNVLRGLPGTLKGPTRYPIYRPISITIIGQGQNLQDQKSRSNCSIYSVS